MRPSVFVSSWYFAPYTGSADVDLYKRLKHCALDFEIVQVRGRLPDARLLAAGGAAVFRRHELDLAAAPARSVEARRRFVDGVAEHFHRVGAGCSVLLSHSNEVPSHEAALALRRERRLPWVAYFGDVISKNPYVPHMREYPLFDEDCRTERETLHQADVVICNNVYQRELLAALVPERADRLVVVPHAYDRALFPQPRPGTNARFTFMHLGALYSVKRVAAPLMAATDVLLETNPNLAGSFEVLFVGDAPFDDDRRAWARMRHGDHVRFVPAVPYLASLELMQRADALVLIDGLFDELSASPFFPGKLADYVGSGKPVLAVSMPRGPTADLQRARGQPLVGDDPSEIAAAMQRMLRGEFASPPDVPELEAEAVGRQMEQVLRSVMNR